MSETTLRPATDLDFADVVLGAVGLVLVAFHHGRTVPSEVLDLAAALPWLCFAHLDADRWPRTPAAYRVVRLPTLLVFSGGEPLMTLDGGQPADRLRHVLEALR
ncbi:hypothetical protein GCM10023340_02680 [Nocardioides marinquilinus]|uniref:Thioredoxin domain-containing protein n=1 Tax=Nocardioides marinquilinus TaxID=1210400 RepID=A0ABP9P621_9ACTN